MSGLPTIVIAGYGTWAMAEVNPAASVLARLAERAWPSCRIETIEIPVVSDALFSRIEELLLDRRPRVWIGLGVAPRSAVVRAEMVAVNWRHFSVPDASGALADQLAVIVGGPTAYNADVPNAEIVSSLQAAGIPAALSFSAGTHLCNQMLYLTRHIVETHNLSTRCGFLHLPQSPENVARQPDAEVPMASMSIAMMTDAVAIAVNRLAEGLASESDLG